MIKRKKASASIGGSIGSFIGLIIGIIIPTDGASLFTRLTGGAVMESQSLLIIGLYVIIGILVCGAIGAILGSLAE